MTEQQWLASNDPAAMLEFLKSSGTARQFRLFACACVRGVLDLLDDTSISLRTIEFAEGFADGQFTKDKLHGRAWGKPGKAFAVVLFSAFEAAQSASEFAIEKRSWEQAVAFDQQEAGKWNDAFNALWPQFSLGEAHMMANKAVSQHWLDSWQSAKRAEQSRQSEILRDIFGNRFGTTVIDTTCLTLAVITLAQTIYGATAFERMPEFAAALEAAGCKDAKLLEHLRMPGHCKGCFAIDAILQKV